MEAPAAADVFILASASPRRADLLRGLVPRFEVHACPFAEPRDKPDAVGPRAWAEALAYFKARAVAERLPGRLVLGADTVVACAGTLLGKPRDLDDARRMLELQAGQPADVLTGVCLLRLAEDPLRTRRICHTDTTRVWMRDDPVERERYLASGDWCGKAGAYGIQDIGDRLVERIAGSFSNVVGLPTELLDNLLKAFR